MIVYGAEEAKQRPVVILLAEDEPGDRELMAIALTQQSRAIDMQTVVDGVEAIEFLRRIEPYGTAPRPDLIILDLNLPLKDGRQVLKEIKHDENLKDIPVVILSTSYHEVDISESYREGASSYLVKPGNFRDFVKVVKVFQEYWLSTVTLPRRYELSNTLTIEEGYA